MRSGRLCGRDGEKYRASRRGRSGAGVQGDGGEMVVEFMKERMDLIDGYIMIYLHIYSFKEIEITNQPF